MLTTTHEISVGGKIKRVPAFVLDDTLIITTGTFVRIAEIFDEYWLEADRLPDPRLVLERLRNASRMADLFTFAQRIPDTRIRFDFHTEWDNVAVIPLSSHATWLQSQISAASRRNIRAAERKGVVVREAPFDDDYVRGILSIYNESAIRHGRRYRHYNKDFATVQRENGTYRERSTFLAAYFRDELIGYMKIVWDARTAAIMQILSKMAFFDKRPNNALLSHAVRLCCERGVSHLLYEQFVYGNQLDSSLTRFKQSNGFVRMDVPRYYVALTHKGRLFLSLGLHRSQRDRIPPWLRGRLREVRRRFYARRAGAAPRLEEDAPRSV